MSFIDLIFHRPRPGACRKSWLPGSLRDRPSTSLACGMWPGLTSLRRTIWPMRRSWCSSSPGSLVEVQGFEAPLRFPYVPGLLSFREVPSLVGALRKVETEVDSLILDAQGLAHPRRMGLASHLGIFLDVPTVGCAKSRLVGSYEEPGREKGSVTDLVHRGETVGRVVRTREGVSPVYVSVGNGIDLKSSVELVLACCTKYRLPESTRQAHNAANRLRRGEELGGSMRLL